MNKQDCTHNFKPVGTYSFDPKRLAVLLYVACSICLETAVEVFPYSHTEGIDKDLKPNGKKIN